MSDLLATKLESQIGIPFRIDYHADRIKILAKKPDPFGWFLFAYVADDRARWIGKYSRAIEVRGKVVVDRAHWNMQQDFADRFEKFMRRCEHLPKEQRITLLAERL